MSGDCAGVSGERVVAEKIYKAASGGRTSIADRSAPCCPRSGRNRPANRPAPFRWLVAAAVIAFAASNVAATARADTIAQNTVGGFGTNNAAFGQSVTTPGGGPWTNIAFNFYDLTINPYATGNLYLLDHQYLGTLANLSSETKLAVATASGGVWTFNPSVTLQSGSQYWFYMDSTSGSTSVLWGSGTYSGGNKYSASAAGSYGNEAINDMTFRLSGTQASPGPIPGAGLLSYLILGFGGAAALRRRLCERAANYFSRMGRTLSALASVAMSRSFGTRTAAKWGGSFETSAQSFPFFCRSRGAGRANA